MRSGTELSQFLRVFLPTFAYVRVGARDNISQVYKRDYTHTILNEF